MAFLGRFRREVNGIIPAVIYFLITFNLLHFIAALARQPGDIADRRQPDSIQDGGGVASGPGFTPELPGLQRWEVLDALRRRALFP